MARPNKLRELIGRRLDHMRKHFPDGYAQLMVAPFPLPPSYAMEDDDSDWWTSQAAIDFAESIKKTNWHG